MNNYKTIFDRFPSPFFILDSFGYILKYNKRVGFKGIKKGKKLTDLIPDCLQNKEGKFVYNNIFFKRITKEIYDDELLINYAVVLIDVTEKESINNRKQEKQKELQVLANSLRESNQELENLLEEIKSLSDYAEQIRLARVIHDNYGHAITDLFMISNMCLESKNKNPKTYRQLIIEGEKIIDKILSPDQFEAGSLKELLTSLSKISEFPIVITIIGEEPDFIKTQYKLIKKICKEAYHNTLDHSLGNQMFINLTMNEKDVILEIYDDGKWHGEFEKGFGLTSMEDNVVASKGKIDFVHQEGQGFKIIVKWSK